jgi:hypothetical protein
MVSFTQRPNSLDRTTPAASRAFQIRPAPLVISAIMAGSSHYLFLPHCGGDASAGLQSCCLGPWDPSGQWLEHLCGDELFFVSLRSRGRLCACNAVNSTVLNDWSRCLGSGQRPISLVPGRHHSTRFPADSVTPPSAQVPLPTGRRRSLADFIHGYAL